MHGTLLFESAVASARRKGRTRVVSLSWDAPPFDPVDVFAAARAQGAEAMLWQRPSEGVALVGIGVEAEFVGEGPERFARVYEQWRDLIDGAFTGDESGAVDAGTGDGDAPDHPGPGPLALGGFAFTPGSAGGAWEGFGDGRLVLPRVVFGFAAGRHWLTVNAAVAPTTEGVAAAEASAADKERWLAVASEATGVPRPADGATSSETDRSPGGGAGTGAAPAGLGARDDVPKERWLEAVRRVASDIRAGKLEKAVLARSVFVPVPDDFSLAGALRRLRADYPETYVFAVAREQGCFFGATPERIVHLARGKANVACMAGSIGRGGTEAEDRELGRRLLADEKNVEEHKVVLRAILHGLRPVCDVVAADGEPGLRKFANVQHLYTPVRARAKEGVDVLQLVSRIHPTPAIGGHPTAEALELIAAEEGMERGWYAGPVGWMNARGEGEFAVGLRSGLLQGDEARLFAGCGIMGDSDPDSEYAESVLKLRPMLRALEAGSASPAFAAVGAKEAEAR